MIGHTPEPNHLLAGQPPDTCLLIGEMSAPRLLGLPDQSLRVPLPSHFIRPEGGVLVEDLLDLAESAVPQHPGQAGKTAVVVVTSHPLTTRECASLFGFSDRRRQLAVVSIAGLAARTLEESEGPGSWISQPGEATLQRRLQNLIAHELGHLRGLAHCSSPSCLMEPVRVAQELDRRSFSACGHCPPARWWTPWRETLLSSTVDSRRVAETRTP